jgi:GNAT superfamily N-acetyltransferase
VRIEQLTLKDESRFPEALELLNRLQGRGIFPGHYLHERARDPRSHIVAAFNGEKMVAAAVGEVLSRFDYYTAFGEEAVADFPLRRVGTLMTMSVHEDFQGQGLGQRLGRARLEWLQAQGCQMIIGVSWVSGQRHTSNRVFEKLGFRAVARRDDFYQKVSLERGFICPACGGPPCQCPAILYRLDL